MGKKDGGARGGDDGAGSGFIWLPRWSDLLNHLVTGSTLYSYGHIVTMPLLPSLSYLILVPLLFPFGCGEGNNKGFLFCVAAPYHHAVYLITRP